MAAFSGAGEEAAAELMCPRATLALGALSQDDKERGGSHAMFKSKIGIIRREEFRSAEEFRLWMQTEAAVMIQICWRKYQNRKVFISILTLLSALERRSTKSIIKMLLPAEASLLDDQTVNAIIRFRLSGPQYPPSIVYKVYFRQEGHSSSVHYFSGKNLIRPCSQAAADACRAMGGPRFLQQMREDAVEDESLGFVAGRDPSSVLQMLKEDVPKRRYSSTVWNTFANANLKEYVKRVGVEDELGAHRGGRDNAWRQLSLDDVVHFQRAIVPPLGVQGLGMLFPLESTHLLQQFEKEQMSGRRKVNSPTKGLPRLQAASAKRQQNGSKTTSLPKPHASALSRHARCKRVEQMRQMYGLGGKSQDKETVTKLEEEVEEAVLSDEEEADALVAWSQQLNVNDSDDEFADSAEPKEH